MRVLCLGSGGYIGTTLCKTLLAEGHQIKAVDNFSRGHADSLIPFCENPDFVFEFGDVTNEQYIKRCVNDPSIDAIILLAAVVGAPASDRNPALSELVTVGG